MAEPGNFHARLAAAARALHDEPDTQHTLDQSALLAIELIPHCHYASISIVHSNRSIHTAAATDDPARRGAATSGSTSSRRGPVWTPSGTTTR